MSVLNPLYQTKVYRVKPQDFFSKIEVAACYIHSDGHYLLLHRAEGQPQELTWGLPAGKVEKGEVPRQAVIREVKEETGIGLDNDHLQEVATLYVRHPHLDFVFHMFTQKCSQRPTVHLSDEHRDFRWMRIEEAFKLPLISGGKEAFYHYLALVGQPTVPRKGFYFVRHGETDVNTDPNIKRVDYDLPLNKRGIQQAILARDIASKLPVKAIMSSPIQRAKQTKKIIADAVDADHSEDVRLSECRADVWSKMVKLEEGENYEVCAAVQNFLSRALSGVAAALEEEGPTLIIAHGGIHWAICYHMMIENHPWKIGNCEIVHFQPVGATEWKAEIAGLPNDENN